MNDALPLVSVIMPVHNGTPPRLFRLAVDSILVQTYRNLEFLIMMDGVTSEALNAAADQVAAADARIRLFRHDGNRGIAASLNGLISEARGDFVARMDADDVSMPARIEEQVAFLRANPDVSILGTFAHEVDERGAVTFEKRLPVSHEEIVRFMSRRDPFIHPTVMFRREFFGAANRYSPLARDSYLEDTELWGRAFQGGARAHNLPRFLYRFLVTSATYTTGRRRGLRFALREAQLRLRHVRKARQPSHQLAWPLLVFAARLCPPALLRMIYKYLR